MINTYSLHISVEFVMPNPQKVKQYLCDLQDTICQYIESFDTRERFSREIIQTRGLARPRVLEGGLHIEKAAVNFTHSVGDALPKAAMERKGDVAGKPFQAVSLSLIVHPRNPYAPTTHANLRFFIIETARPIWWFGGGYDLTPFYGFEEDAQHWHRTAKAACDPFGEDVYPNAKDYCDRYFFLPHRKETRGIGGLFFEDWNRGGFDTSLQFVQSIGDSFLKAYSPILERRTKMRFGDREREHQLYRRGRYVEFNLLYDRGTRYGLQSGKRIESVLASMPPMVRNIYNYQPEEGSPEHKLYTDFLHPRDWI